MAVESEETLARKQGKAKAVEGVEESDVAADDEDEEDKPIVRIEAYLDEVEELLDETETVADKEASEAERATFRDDLRTAAAAVRTTHTKVKALLRKERGK